MTPVSTPTADNETSSSPFYGLLQQIPLQCFEQERFLQSEILGVQVYPEKGILVLRLKMSAPVPAETYASVSHYLKESLPGVGRVVLDVHYAPSVVTPAEYMAAHEKEFLFCLTEETDIAEGWFSHYRIEVKGSNLSFQVPHELARQQLDRKQCEKFLQDILQKRCGAAVTAKLEINPNLLPEIPTVAEVPAGFDAAPKALQSVLI